MAARLGAAFWHTALGTAVVAWSFGYILVDIFAFLQGRSAPGTMLLASLPMLALGVAQTLALDGLHKLLARFAPLLRWGLFFAAALLATLVQSLFDLYWLRWLSLTLVPDWQAWALAIAVPRLFTVGLLYLWTFSLVLTLLWAARVRGAAEASAARAATAEAAAARSEASRHQAEATALRLQLNPHFLFNTLNSISCLVVVDQKQAAEEMIDQLAEFLRASLESDPMADVPLAQEIDSINAYLDIEATRFRDRLSIEINVDPGAAEALVPNFILQPLVENAIKHGVGAIRGQASLIVSAARAGEALLLCVFNSSPRAGEERALGNDPDAPGRRSTGIGLANTRQRLAHRYGGDAWLETAREPLGYRASIRLPFHKASQAALDALG